MRILKIVESRPTELVLSAQDAASLRSLGRQFSSASTWWGATDESDEAPSRSVIQVTPAGAESYWVTIMNMVGVIRLPDAQLEVAPKIPESHFLYLTERATLSPRTDTSEVNIEADASFAEILALWFLEDVEGLLRRGLRPDYLAFDDELPAVRGHLKAVETTLAIMQGQPVAHCTFEELSEDAPLNRVLKAACQRLASNPTLRHNTRTRARRASFRFQCTEMRPTDLLVHVDRTSGAYKSAVSLAKLVLRSLGVSLHLGAQSGTAFLIRTPELIEEGLRNVVSRALPGVSVSKRAKAISKTGLTMNPDLVFNGSCAVGDIKYRTLGPDWRRNDLYQVVAFAAAFRTEHSVLLGFSQHVTSKIPQRVQVGDIHVQPISWCADASISPAESERMLHVELQHWWSAIRCGFSLDLRASLLA
ncbi:McrC family protein [Variovorax sp. Sphag1AA]|uniref:McrC family protein n=1 Tax=Variovorax sp. Sphag1AA TaxID=2587027 RepID=UPI0016168336|nr:hypothetical protein [Variovorax sp. Sphag1AA]MBB3180080.1 5-methylcytosine-specific restriction endonuclease McrBC regulatory subunit McrC [Variovorax sp. Sphag1AA]